MIQDYNQAFRATDSEALKDTLARLQHGDTVKAVFYDKHYKTFEITGIVNIASYDEHLFILASWFLNTPAVVAGKEGRGKPSSFLKDLQIIGTEARTLF